MMPTELPQDGASDEELGELLADFLDSSRHSRHPDVEAFLARHPRHAPQLKRWLKNWTRFQQWSAPLRGLVAPVTIDQRGSRTDGNSSDAARAGQPPRFADYEIQRELGRGGMGVVYLARQRSLDRLVALKVFRPGALPSPADELRFRNEALIAAGLDHPGIVPILEVSADEGPPFFSMKLIDGGNLSEQAARYQADARAAARLIAAVARAVHHAHQRGVLHRDLKPSNVLLDRNDQPHVSDFGLAKQIESDSALTHTGALIGTPSYMAPEQAQGKKGQVTIATDVYGLGAMFYTLLAGKPPFRGETVLETIQQLQSGELTPPSACRPGVPADLQTICLKCLERQPARRYRSAEALAEDLERWLNGEPIHARPNHWWERLIKSARRRPTTAALVVVSALALAATVTGLSIYNRHLDEALAVSDRLRQDGLDREANLRQHLYVAEMRAAHQAWMNGDVKRAVGILERHVPAAGQPDARDFAWYFLWNSCTRRPRFLGRHDSAVLALAVSPDGRWLASGDKRGAVKIWDLTSHTEQRELQGSGVEVCSLCFSPDGQTLAVAGMEWAIRLYDVTAWTERKKLIGFVNTVRSIAISPDGKLLAAGIVDDTVRLWDLADGTPREQLKAHADDVQSVAWSADGRRLLTASNDRSVKLWDVPRQQLLREIPQAHHSTVLSATFVPGRPLAVTGGYDRWIRLWDLDNGHEWVSHPANGTVRSVGVSEEGRWLAAGDGDGILCLLEMPTSWRGLRSRRVLEVSESALRAVAFTRRGLLAVGDEGGEVRTWKVADLSGVASRTLPNRIAALAPDGRFVIEESAKGPMYMRNRDASLDQRENMVSLSRERVAMAPNGGAIVLTAPDGCLTAFDTSSRQTRRLVCNIQRDVIALGMSHDESLIATVDVNGGIRLFNSRSGALSATLSEGDSTQPIDRAFVQFAPDDQTLYTAAAHGCTQIDLWSVVTGKRRRSLTLDGAPTIYAFSLNGAGNRLAVACNDRLIRVWDLAADNDPVTLAGHTDEIRSLAFSSDGRTLVSVAAGADRSVRLWHLGTAQELFTLYVCCELPRHIAFSKDGRTLTMTTDRTDGRSDVVVWQTRP